MQHSVHSDKRRAIAARLLVCLLPFAVAALLSATAQAAPPKAPRLVSTNPASSADTPASSTTPSIIGEAEPEGGIIIDSYPGTLDSSPIFQASGPHPTEHPNYEIVIFEGPGCSGARLAVGTAAELEGSGIPVLAAADFKSVYSAWQVDPENPIEESACSNELFYWEGNVPTSEYNGGAGSGNAPAGGGTGETPAGTTPAGGTVSPAVPVTPTKLNPPHIHTSPGGRANDVTPLVVGSAQDTTTVSIFASADCSGGAIAKGSADQLAAGIKVSVSPNAETALSAMTVVGGRHSACSEPVTYFEDSSAPHTRVTMGPGVKTRKHKVIFRFQDITEDPPGTTFACKVDKGKWKACSSPFHIKHLKVGKHTLAIRATDLAGNVEPKPVKRRFSVVRKSH
jgi:hypothetical protein